MPNWKSDEIMTVVPILSFAVDRKETLVYCRGALSKKLALDDPSLIGQPAFRMAQLPIKKNYFRKALNGESISITISLKGFNLETHLIPFFEDASIVGVVGLSVDMTKHIQLEQYIDEEKHRLLAAQRLNSLAGIARGLAHEINNPLAIISGYAEQLLIQAEKGTLSPERLLFTTKKLVDTCNRCHRLIESIKTFARDGSHDSFQPSSINEWVEATLVLCRERFQSTGVRLEWQALSHDLTFEGRLLQLVQALFNIVVNALEATGDSKDPWVRLSCEDFQGDVLLHVDDNGPGISESNRTSVFEPFFTTKDQSRSIGIGLSTAKGLIEAHQGQLSFTSRPGATRFTIRVPKNQKPLDFAV